MSRIALFFTLVLAALPGLRADEGLWTFDNLPVKKLQADYGFTPTPAWLDHLRLSALRFPGGSGSFISADGLVLTNHHVGRGSVQAVSDRDHDYVKDGFLAASRAEEKRIPGLELFTLMGMEDVTARVNRAVPAGASDKDALKARKAELGKLKKEIQERTGFTAEAVTLYQGGEYWIYTYQKHTDVRLVMAPEQQIAFFGGDHDNFTYPRHNLDFCLFRVYQDGRPYHPAHHLAWSRSGARNGDLTFVVGHPGSTERLGTERQMASAADLTLPLRVQMLERQREALLAYAKGSPEQARQANTLIFGLENSLKAIHGYIKGLNDKGAIARIRKAEAELRAKVAADPASDAAGSWGAISKALLAQMPLYKESLSYSGRGGAVFGSPLLGQALTLVRMGDEAQLPSDRRLEVFQDANLENLKKRLLVESPFYPGLETALLAFGLKEAAGTATGKVALAGQSPAAVAKALVDGTHLADPAVRRSLVEGGRKAVLESRDPLIVLARQLDGPIREFDRKFETEVTSVIAEHGARIARARFNAYGKSVYPDATFTLRLTYGPVAPYAANGTLMQPFTTFHGLFDRAIAWGPEAGHGDWALPPRWLEAKDRLDLSTPFVFCHAVDIIGGNSGSPVVDTRGELLGLTFDGNIESLPGHFYYDGSVNRGLAVDGRAILEALDKVYGASSLVAEIRGR